MPDLFGDPRAVPDLSNVLPENAETLVLVAGFGGLALGEARFSDAIDAGYVMAQSPTAGTLADAGAIVTVYLSTGSENPEIVPYLIGKTLQPALIRIASIYGIADVSGSSGTVVTQSPEAFTTVSRNTTISIVMGGAINALASRRRVGLPPYMGREA